MKRPGKIRILIADDHFIVRMGLIALVNTEPDMEVIAEAAHGDSRWNYPPGTQIDFPVCPLKRGIYKKDKTAISLAVLPVDCRL